MNNYHDILKKVFFFSMLSDDDIEALQSVCREKHCQTGEVIISEGSVGNNFYIIIKGGVEIWKNYGAPDQDLVASYGRGQLFGEMALIEKCPRCATVVSRTPTNLLYISRDDFNRVIKTSNPISHSIMRSISNKVRQSNERYIENLKAHNRLLIQTCEQLRQEISKREKAEESLLEANTQLEQRVRARTDELIKSNTRLKQEIEDRKKLQRQLLRSERLAATGQLAAFIAHEINSPLQAIKMLLATLMDKHQNDPDLLQNFQIFKRAVHSIYNTVQDLLDLNRPSREKKQLIEINTIVQKTASLVGCQLKNAQIKLVEDLASNLPPIIASPQQLTQCLLNLINNANESISEHCDSMQNKPPQTETPAIKPNGQITIRTRLNHGHIDITVADDGPGIAAEAMEHLFDPFYTNKKRKGVGIGLSVSYAIIEDHQGVIKAENAPQGGAVFTITLPVRSTDK